MVSMVSLALYCISGGVIFYTIACMARIYYKRVAKAFSCGGVYNLVKGFFLSVTGIVAFLMLLCLAFKLLGYILCETEV